MAPPITFAELPIPASLDVTDADTFRAATAVRNTVQLDARGPAADPDTPAEMLSYLHDQGAEHKQWHVARAAETMVAYAISTWSIDPATRVTWLEVGVLPAWQGQGIGTAVCDRMEALARAAGRPVVQGGAFHLPTPGPVLASPTGFGAIPREDRTARFLLARGYTLEQVYRYSALQLPADAAMLEDHWATAAAKAGTAYRVHTWTGSTPERWRDDVAVIFTRMATDAPAGNMEIDEEPWTAERVRLNDARRIAAGRMGLGAVVEHLPSRRLVAYNGLSLPADRSRPVHQGITLVLAEHRGHRLGMLTKIANIRQLEAVSPTSPCILTDNAEENRPMLAVNEAVGFVPIAYEGAWKRVLA